ncbi:hypothetical protein HY251_09790 [bacterium]|nr:hypothetical protein [bacterium]
MPAERDRILGELAVEHGLLSREEADRYYASIDAAPGAPALSQLIVRDGKATAQDLARLREIWQARAAVAAVASPVPAPAGAGALDAESLRKDEALARVLVSRSVLSPERARDARAQQLREGQRLGPLLVRGGLAPRAEVEDAIAFLKAEALLCPVCGAIHEKSRLGPAPTCSRCGSALVPAVSEESGRLPPPPASRPTSAFAVPIAPLGVFPVPSTRLGPGGEDPEAETARHRDGSFSPAKPLDEAAPLDPFASERGSPRGSPTSPTVPRFPSGGVPAEGWLDSREGQGLGGMIPPVFPGPDAKINMGASVDELRFTAPGLPFGVAPGGDPPGGPGSNRGGPPGSAASRGGPRGSSNPAGSGFARGDPAGSGPRGNPGSSGFGRGDPAGSGPRGNPGSSGPRGNPAGSGFARGGAPPAPAWTPAPESGFPAPAPSGDRSSPGAAPWSPFPAGEGAQGGGGAFPPFAGGPDPGPGTWAPNPAFGADPGAPPFGGGAGAPPSGADPARKKKGLENLKARAAAAGPKRPAPPAPTNKEPLVPVWVLVVAGAMIALGAFIGLTIWVMKKL